MEHHPDDVLDAPPDAPVVTWMDRPPLSVGAAKLAGALTGAFLLGVGITIAAVVVGRFLETDDDDDEVVLRRIW